MRLPIVLAGLVACAPPPAQPPLQHRAPLTVSERTGFASFWRDRGNPYAERRCTDADYATVSGRSAESPLARAVAWWRLSTTCHFEWSDGSDLDAASMNAYVAYGTALLDASYPQDCARLLATLTTPYPGGLMSHAVDPAHESLVDAITSLAHRCDAANEKRLADFQPVVCPGSSCFELADREKDPCPIIQQPGDPPRVLLATAGPLRDSQFCCGPTTITTAMRDGVSYLRVIGDLIARVCGGGTAAKQLDGIYRIAGEALVLESDDSILLH